MSEYTDGTLEIKYADVTAVDVPGRTVVGYASTWEVDKTSEAFARGAWDDDPALRQGAVDRVGVHWMHQAAEIPLGVVQELATDARGLRFKVAVLDSPRGLELLAYLRQLLNRGITPGVSVGFRTLAQSWRKVADRSVRIIEKAALKELSFTIPTLQANAGAVVTAVKTATDPTAALCTSLRATADALDVVEAQKTAPVADPARAAALGAELDALQPFVDPRVAALHREIAEAKAWLWGQEIATWRGWAWDIELRELSGRR